MINFKADVIYQNKDKGTYTDQDIDIILKNSEDFIH
jgi:hypothetical protein